MFSQSTADTQPERVLVGRDEQLALAERRWSNASAGHGHFLLIAGEAGIGKTRLLTEIASRLDSPFSLAAAVFSHDIEAVGGLILDLCAALDRTDASTIGDALRERLTEVPNPADDQSRRRRILVGDLARMIGNLLEQRPTLLGIEDLHWADELSLEVLERVATALPRSSSMIIATYRSDELYPRTPLRRTRSRLLEQRLAEEVRLPRLDEEQTSALIRSLVGERPMGNPRSVYERSDGIPLFVEELLADDSSSVPTTIADAVALRLEALAPSTVAVVEAAAVIGRSFAVDLLEAVAATERDDVDAALAELASRNLVLAAADGATLDFRHALLRDAVYEGIAPLRKRDLHAAVAVAAIDAGFRESFISDQLERARKPTEAYHYALSAARDATRVSSHREAVELFRRAQRTAPTALAPTERAALYSELAREMAATDDNVGAAVQLADAIEIYRKSGDELSAAALVPRLVAAQHLVGVGYAARANLLDDALGRIDGLEPPAFVRASLLAALSAAYMLDRHLDEAMTAAAEAAAIAEQSDSVAERIDIDTTLGSVLVFAGSGDEGWRLIESATVRARDLQLETQAARGYRMIGSSASVLVEYPRATTWISEGLEYCSTTENWNDFHYLNAHRAHVLWATGDWTGAREIASTALEQGRGGVTTRSTALLVLGYLSFGTGDFGAARRYLDEAREIGERMRELQRLGPALWGLSESELLNGNAEAAVELAELAYSMSEPIGDAAYSFPFLTTGVRAYLAMRDNAAAQDWFERSVRLLRARAIPGTLPAIAHGDGLLLLASGRGKAARIALEEARTGWAASGRFWDGARATIDLAHCMARSRLPREAARLLELVRGPIDSAGATALRYLASRVAVDADSSGPLSSRELEVARLVATGSTNREIADALTISPKTASAHIEHILAKLGVSRRSEIAAWVSRLPD